MDVSIVQMPAGKTREALSLVASAGLHASDLTTDMLQDFLIALDEKQHVRGVVGMQVLGEVGLLRALAVAPDCQGCGVGKQLVRGLEVHAERKGVSELYLLTLTADSFFRNLGYQPTERLAVPDCVAYTEEFQTLCPASAVCLCKQLSCGQTGTA